MTTWTLTIEGEGEHSETLDGHQPEWRAIEWAEKLIRAGDYDLEPGETTTVRYHLRRGDVQVDRHVEVYRSEDES
jgi:xanthine/CO dehydrogenase XdhC/CoxF family maturation factor